MSTSAIDVEIGDVVYLKSNPETLMTVVGPLMHANNAVDVAWFIGAQLYKDSFPIVALANDVSFKVPE